MFEKFQVFVPFYILNVGEETHPREKKIPDNGHEVTPLLGPFCVVWFVACFLRVTFIESYSGCINTDDIHTCANQRITSQMLSS